MNLYGSWFIEFWRSGWNVFDFIVDLSGVLTMAQVAALKQLKMLRAFRIFRLFKRIRSLNKIVTALLKAIPGVANAFVIMLIVMAIYAILAVEYFSEFGQGTPTADFACVEHEHCYLTSKQIGIPGQPNASTAILEVTALTTRDLPYGYEYYGSFFKALYTMFQVLTGESWSEAVARPLIFGKDGDSAPSWFSAVFFVSFILLTQIVLVNVVVAVLLDQFVTDPPKEEAAETTEPDATPPQAASGANGMAPAPAPAGAPEQHEGGDAERETNVELQLSTLQQSVDALKGELKGMADMKQMIDAALLKLGGGSAGAGDSHASPASGAIGGGASSRGAAAPSCAPAAAAKPPQSPGGKGEILTA